MWKQPELSVHSTADELRARASRLRQDLSSSLTHATEEFDSRARDLETAESGLGQIIDELQRGRQDLLDIFEASPNAYVVTDDRREILQANRSAARLLNLLPSGLIGQRWPEVLGRDVLRSDDGPGLLGPNDWNTNSSFTLAEGELQIGETLLARVSVLPTRPGTGSRLLWHLSRARRAPETDHLLPSKVTSAADEGVGEEAPGELLWQAFDRSVVGMIILSIAHDEQVFLNRSAARLLGPPSTSKPGLERYDGSVYLPDGRPHAICALCRERMLRGKAVIGETALIRARNGPERWVRICGGPLTDASGKPIGALVIVDDITAIHEEQRRRAEWMSVIVHDLRAPLAIISGYAQLLEKASSKQGQPGSTARAIETIRANAVRLNRMISDLLDASRIEISKLDLQRQRINLVPVVHRVAEGTQNTTADRLVEIVSPPCEECPVLVDSQRIEQVLENLLQNAMKYGTPGTPVQIGIASDGKSARVWITNQGPGISPEEKNRLFRRFHRALAASQSKSGGLGLGLYIARGIVEAHGGRISVESVPNETTTFTITLPVAPAVAPPGIQNAW